MDKLKKIDTIYIKNIWVFAFFICANPHCKYLWLLKSQFLFMDYRVVNRMKSN